MPKTEGPTDLTALFDSVPVMADADIARVNKLRDELLLAARADATRKRFELEDLRELHQEAEEYAAYLERKGFVLACLIPIFFSVGLACGWLLKGL